MRTDRRESERQESRRHRARARRRLRYATAAAGAAAALLVAALLVALLNPATPASLLTVGSDYALNLSTPHNAQGSRGAADLQTLAKAGDSAILLRAESDTISADKRFKWSTAVNKLDGPATVLYVSLHGAADDAGPYLLRPDGSPSTPTHSRLRVEDLIDALQELPATRRKLIVFDATTSDGQWRHGHARNRFAEGLRHLNERIETVPGLVIVSASDADQLSWAEDRARRTVFADAFIEGLRGAAVDANHDGRIDGRELLRHVEREVAQRVGAARAQRQSPLVLPLGAPGEQRLADLQLAYANGAYEPSPPRLTPTPRELIANAWDVFHTLRQRLGAPECDQPVAWRRRQRLALRYEQLLLADADRAALRVATQIESVDEELVRANLSAATAASDDLATVRAAADNAIGTLLTAQPGQVPVKVQATMANVAEPQRAALRRALATRAVDRVYDDPIAVAPSAARLIQFLAATGAPVAADAHLVSVLDELPEDLSDPAWPAAVRLAIETRRASQAPLIANERTNQSLTRNLLPFLRAPIEEADRKRLLGEDLLFTGGGSLRYATSQLAEALDRYKSIAENAHIARRALRLRDVAFDRLPFYADAIAAIRPTSAKASKRAERVATATEIALAATHDLADRLLEAAAHVERPGVAAGSISTATEKLDGALSNLQTEFRQWLAQIAQSTGPTLVTNREAALRVPNLTTADRLLLIGLTADASAASQLGRAMQRDAADPWRPRPADQHARMATAVIGQRAFDRAAGHEGAFAETHSEEANADRTVSICAQAHIAALANARRIASDEPTSETDRADRDARRDAADDVRRYATGATPDGARLLAEQTGSRSRQLSLWRAGRAIAASWMNEPIAGEPRYRRLALAAVQDAERAEPGHPTIQRTRQAALADRGVQVRAPSTIDVVSASSPPISLSIDAVGGSPLAPTIDGVAAVSVTTPRGVRRLSPTSGARLARAVGSNPGFSEPALRLGVDEARLGTDATVGLQAWFRGARADASLRVRGPMAPSVAIDNPPRPRGAGVAIVGVGEGGSSDAAVAFVLDASGSMGPGDETGSTYRRAVSTLRGILTDVPRGVRVSVWVFGEAVGAEKTTDNAESTIRRVLAPTPWEPTDTARIDRLVQRLSFPAVEPWNESPLTRAILLASRDLRGATASKAIIAITDGVDNRFATDAYANPRGESIESVVNAELEGSGVAIHVVGFGISADASQAARRQFDFVQRRAPAGRWWEADEAPALDRALRSALVESRSTSLRPSDSSAAAMVATPISTDPARPVWRRSPLPAGLYELPRVNANGAVQHALLGGGDLLMLAPVGSRLLRASYSGADAASRPGVETPQWRVALLADRRLPSGGRRALLAIEKAPTSEEPIRVDRPSRVWIESSDRTTPIAWRRRDGYPAPCWEVTWPRHEPGSNADLTVWWSWSEDPASALTIRRNSTNEPWTALVGKRWELPSGAVRLRRMAIETQPLPTSEGRVIDQPSLVVEVGCEARCVTRLEGLVAAGARHGWYDDSGVATSTYWPVTQRDVERALEGIDVVSVADFKRRAESEGCVARLEQVPPPRSDDHQPTPAVDWFEPPASAPGLNQVGAVQQTR